jgi:hypothetical protein
MLIGLAGKKRSGKDTVGNYLIQHYNFIKRGFADPLKEACKIIFNLSDSQVYGNNKEVIDNRWETTPRKILQVVGTELFRERLSELFPNIQDKIWLRNFEIWYNNIKNRINVSVVDMRFLNEINLIKKLDGKTILVRRDAMNTIDNHSSENEFLTYNKFDYIIDNNSTFQNLYLRIDEIMLSLGIEKGL